MSTSEDNNSGRNPLSPERLKKVLHKQALAELNENLNVNERAMIVIEGLSGQAMIVTNQQRVLVFKRGFMGGVAFGRRLYAWHFNQIQGVAVDIRVLKGFVALELIESNVEGLTYWGNGEDDRWNASNTIPLDVSKEKEVREGAKALRLTLHEFHHPPASPVRLEQSPNVRPKLPPIAFEQLSALPAANETPTAKFCFNCGAALRPASSFCATCGQELL